MWGIFGGAKAGRNSGRAAEIILAAGLAEVGAGEIFPLFLEVAHRLVDLHPTCLRPGAGWE